MARTELDAQEIRELLAELGRRLDAEGVAATIYVVGGAAIALQTDQRRVTVDVDAVFHPETTVADVAATIAAERGLPRNWLNQSVRAWLPGEEDTDAVRLDLPGLAVALASPEHLLAMKMAAFRPTDIGDLVLLFEQLGITTPEQAADIALGIYGTDTVVLPGRDELLLSAQAVLNRLRRKRTSS